MLIRGFKRDFGWVQRRLNRQSYGFYGSGSVLADHQAGLPCLKRLVLPQSSKHRVSNSEDQQDKRVDQNDRWKTRTVTT